MSEAYSRIAYAGSTPGADASTYNLFSTVTAFPMANALPMAGVHRVVLAIKNPQAGTLKIYKSVDRGVNWTQIDQDSVAAAAATAINFYDKVVEPYADWKADWVNGGVAQTGWTVDISLIYNRSATI